MIIALGQNCNISGLLQNVKLKKQTGLFEWFTSDNLNDITDIFNKISNNENPIITKNNTHMLMGNLYTTHYNLDNFKDIYIRRRDRMIEDIKNNSTIFFVRFEYSIINYTELDIDNFINSVKKINPNVDIKILFICPNKVEHPQVLTQLYDKHQEDILSVKDDIKDLCVNGLVSLGYTYSEKCDTIFNDMSLI
jgi:hypothetical protein